MPVTVKGGGRFKPPDLSDPQLKAIGDEMVKAQLDRWSKGVNASGNAAKKLSRGYFFVKRRLTGINRPIRDMRLTGLTVKNFMLRRAAKGVIRAENSTRDARKHAQRSQGIEEMIGFAGSDQNTVFNASLKQYGTYMKRAFVQVNK